MNGESRLSVLKIPRRQHAGKTSVENLDLQWQKDQERLKAKMQAKQEILAKYDKNHQSQFSPITHTPTRIPRPDGSRPGTPTVPENGVLAPESEFGSTTVEYDRPETPLAIRHKRRDSGSINLFASPPSLQVHDGYKIKPPFATDDETPRRYRPSKSAAPFATDDDDQPSTKPASSKPPVSFCWQWAFQDEDGNPLPEADPATPVATGTPDFSRMSPRSSPRFLAAEFDDEA
jgi:hypothetical protein